ncbi:MAG: alkyl hydroperoxide reductase [Sphingomonadales bacterium RIFCSPHIGHO2_01_FULL_65_20]|jgi:peroxiredoxin|uniref:thioredoxin family protein n=1 Tax=unclassified Blastomonas TaxID=2626550 RepID=UPI000833FB26|nr:thioredoxin family protein [Blastomonas sp.]MCH2238210.1 thioredoxin family protein [Blastomonas sp.]OHC97967.1 MAG: alkyl hydroperoxide reductase [Sphingomonadales bacterium RIFCSPHIGHO2_01_FULL_65_20]
MLRWSRQLDYGQQAAPFALPDTDGRIRTLEEFEAPALLVAFICNHCPVVLHVLPGLIDFAREYASRGLQVVAISSNSPEEFPEDDYPHMQRFAKDHDLPFPYLHDESQDVALAYNAICTPDFFLYGPDRALFYTGQFCASRPKLPHPPVPGAPPQRTDVPVTGQDMRAAVDALLAGRPAPEHQVPSAGCSIKWLPGKNPSWG